MKTNNEIRYIHERYKKHVPVAARIFIRQYWRELLVALTFLILQSELHGLHAMTQEAKSNAVRAGHYAALAADRAGQAERSAMSASYAAQDASSFCSTGFNCW